jgi:protein TonB
MRWSMVPVSVAVHAAVLGVFLFGPLASDIELPSPWFRAVRDFVMAAPAPVPVDRASATESSRAAPTKAADHIETEPPAPTASGVAEGGLALGGPPATGASFDLNVGAIAPPPSPPPVVERPSPLRVGGSIREPRKLVHVAAVYPEVARQVKLQGIVIIEATIDERGFVTDVRVLRSKPMLDEAALMAVRQWRYTPTLLNGVPVRVLMTITFNFQLTE